ncbi:hypothetical protein N7468_002997 [Penicillium chermesinum]|uniref:Uncharacterized protein n=1 Tax=Penicillium chermesinum TaxID=63820 RepID=A0A9W9P8A1_9EURO|nr:uncharacterized protein N7468_002997 [Penicillium chermesinum]KAJ5238378.1 hypothetical protein N7468_002997 [Penicillium chermesinum]
MAEIKQGWYAFPGYASITVNALLRLPLEGCICSPRQKSPCFGSKRTKPTRLVQDTVQSNNMLQEPDTVPISALEIDSAR